MTIIAHLAPMLEAEDATAFDAFLRASPFGAYHGPWPRPAMTGGNGGIFCVARMAPSSARR
jgi:hypothetical protein